MFLTRWIARRRDEAEAVTRYVDALVALGTRRPVAVATADSDELADLYGLARQLLVEMRPAAPPAPFEAALSARLVAAAARREPTPARLALWQRPGFARTAAAVGSLLSLAAIAALLLRNRVAVQPRVA